MVVVFEFLMVVRPWLPDGDLMWYQGHRFSGDRVYHFFTSLKTGLQVEGGSSPYWAVGSI